MSLPEPPRAVRFADESKRALVLEWQDGHVSTYALGYLRGWCPCAACQGHSGPPRWQAPQEGIRLTALRQVGAYALGLEWSDGHATGLHAFDLLREQCPCEDCGGAPPGTPSEVLAECRRR